MHLDLRHQHSNMFPIDIHLIYVCVCVTERCDANRKGLLCACSNDGDAPRKRSRLHLPVDSSCPFVAAHFLNPVCLPLCSGGHFADCD